jgi:hypothetical protein
MIIQGIVRIISPNYQLHELRNKVRQLKSDNGGGSSKDELRRTYQWTEADLMFSDQVITFAKEYLFP